MRLESNRLPFLLATSSASGAIAEFSRDQVSRAHGTNDANRIRSVSFTSSTSLEDEEGIVVEVV